MKKTYKLLLLIVILLSILLAISGGEVNHSFVVNKNKVNEAYKTQVEYDNYYLFNFGDYRFAIRKYEKDSERFLYDRKKQEIIYDNISDFKEFNNCVYVISNTTDEVLKLNYSLNTVYKGTLDSFDDYDKEIFDRIKNKKSLNSLILKFIKLNKYKDETTLAYFGDGSIRICKNKENQYELIDVKNDKVIDTINKFIINSDMNYEDEHFSGTNLPTLYCIGNNGYIKIYLSTQDNNIIESNNLDDFDSYDKSIFNNPSTDWTILN